MRAFFLTILFVNCLCAESKVYTWKDSNGVVHYSNSNNNKSAETAELPEINRGEIQLGHLNLISCDQHGGVDCQAGPDRDGSVICADGFADASPVYRFSCNSPKLKIASISEINENGTFTVNIRNLNSVQAKNSMVTIDIPQKGIITLEGPKEIEPYGLAEYKLNEQYAFALKLQPTIADIELDCANCP